MTNWRVERNGILLSHFLCGRLVLKHGTLYAENGVRIIGSVASGAGLTWTLAQKPDVKP